MPPAALRVSTPDAELTLPGDRSAVVGRAPESDVVIRHPRVSRRHLALEPVADGWLARDLSSNGIWYQGKSVSSVRIGDMPTRLRLGGEQGPELILTALPAGADGESEAEEPAVDEEETRISPNTGRTPVHLPAPTEAPAAAPAGAPSVAAYWGRRVPTLVWLFAAAFTVGALLALA